MFLSAYNFIVLYLVFLGTELWLLVNSIGDRAANLPVPIRFALGAAVILLPALCALAIMGAPDADLPESY